MQSPLRRAINLQMAFDNVADSLTDVHDVINLGGVEVASGGTQWGQPLANYETDLMDPSGGIQIPTEPVEEQNTPLSAGEGSIGHLQNQFALVASDSDGRDSRSPGGDVMDTPPQIVGGFTQGGLLDGSSGWTTDSRDINWMLDYSDFVGNNSSDKNNSNWILFDDEELSDSDTESFDVERYQEYTYLDPIQAAAIERIQHLYGDSQWDQTRPVLAGDRQTFRGPFPVPIQRHTRNKPTARSFFDQWWDDASIDCIVAETNPYAGQLCTNVTYPRRRGKPARSNGGPGWIPTTRRRYERSLESLYLWA